MPAISTPHSQKRRDCSLPSLGLLCPGPVAAGGQQHLSPHPSSPREWGPGFLWVGLGTWRKEPQAGSCPSLAGQRALWVSSVCSVTYAIPTPC